MYNRKFSLRTKLGFGFGTLLLILTLLGGISYKAAVTTEAVSHNVRFNSSKKDLTLAIQLAIERRRSNCCRHRPSFAVWSNSSRSTLSNRTPTPPPRSMSQRVAWPRTARSALVQEFFLQSTATRSLSWKWLSSNRNIESWNLNIQTREKKCLS